MRNRYILCLLLCGVLLYLALPHLSPFAGGIEGLFSIAWLLFALIAMAGNMAALLFTPKKSEQPVKQAPKVKKRLFS